MAMTMTTPIKLVEQPTSRDLANSLRALADDVEANGATSAVVILEGMDNNVDDDVRFLGRPIRLPLAIGLLMLAVSRLEARIRDENA